MPANVTELQKSRRVVAGESADYFYLVRGTADETVALQAVLDTAPGTLNSFGHLLVSQPPEIEPIAIDGANSFWEARVSYKAYNPQPPPQAGDDSFQFDTTGGTQHITQSLAQVASYGRGGATAPNFKGGIGFDGETFLGCDITVPVYKFSETHYFEPGRVNQAYKLAVFNLTGRTNSAAFRGFNVGEVLFLGASGSRKGRHVDDLWEITFQFAASVNKTNLAVGEITGIEKKGWEYLWVMYEPVVDETAKALVKNPKGVYVECVYNAGDFAGLGITQQG